MLTITKNTIPNNSARESGAESKIPTFILSDATGSSAAFAEISKNQTVSSTTQKMPTLALPTTTFNNILENNWQ